MAKLLGNFVVSSGSRMAVGKHGVEPAIMPECLAAVKVKAETATAGSSRIVRPIDIHKHYTGRKRTKIPIDHSRTIFFIKTERTGSVAFPVRRRDVLRIGNRGGTVKNFCQFILDISKVA